MSLLFPTLSTARLRLRRVTMQDADALFAIHSDVEWMKWYGVEPVTQRVQAEQLADMFSGWFVAGTGFRWALERRLDGRLIGTCGLFRWNKSWRNCVIGYELARDCRRQGYMREALETVIDYGFDRMQVHRIQAETHPDNHDSIQLAQRLGFRYEGVHREQAYWSGHYHDLNCYSLLEQDWRQSQRSRDD
ncbi:ribosomal-protein-alanine N-acetyltransferase [Noviherbaspirillum humi]|uniref:Ribosomal-protein-alanine N-acetyltransferase n=1 Tax=Noviherbaspirillum humi TaxID=1688639 RepID=A0A239H4I8_9BURK|nr:GNAT family protein [Noviherbaspirillum humi]SNS76329.1 ribosomal-protein-alanine N-acetyltransferase [Noviherbaspirillum humi]